MDMEDTDVVMDMEVTDMVDTVASDLQKLKPSHGRIWMRRIPIRLWWIRIPIRLCWCSLSWQEICRTICLLRIRIRPLSRQRSRMLPLFEVTKIIFRQRFFSRPRFYQRV